MSIRLSRGIDHFYYDVGESFGDHETPRQSAFGSEAAPWKRRQPQEKKSDNQGRGSPHASTASIPARTLEPASIRASGKTPTSDPTNEARPTPFPSTRKVFSIATGMLPEQEERSVGHIDAHRQISLERDERHATLRSATRRDHRVQVYKMPAVRHDLKVFFFSPPSVFETVLQVDKSLARSLKVTLLLCLSFNPNRRATSH
jgi:hypothetical protein